MVRTAGLGRNKSAPQSLFRRAVSLTMPNFIPKSKGLSINLHCCQEMTDHAD